MLQRNISFTILAMLLIIGCMARLTTKQQTLWALEVFNHQYDLYLDQVIDPAIVDEDRNMLMENPELITNDMIRPDLSDEQKKILKEKKKILVELYPIIMTIHDLSVSGVNLDTSTHNKMIELVNRLINLVED